MGAIAINAECISDACHDSLAANSCRYLAHIEPEGEDEVRDRLVTRVEGKRNLFQCFFGTEQSMDPLIDFPPQYPTVTCSVKACLH
jgi:hypothetical protein